MNKKKFIVEGMTCQACKNHVDKAVRTVSGVKDVNVNLLTNSMEVVMEDDSLIDDINKAVDKAGYHSYIKGMANKEDDNLIKDKETPKMLKRLILSLILLIPLFILSMGYMMHWFNNLLDYPMFVGLIEFLLSTIILYINRNYFISGFKSSIHLNPNMDTLVGLGSGVAYIYSTILLIIMTFNINNSNELMRLSMLLAFETSAMVPSLITVGKTLESFSKGKTTSAINSLIKLAPKRANIIRDNKEINVDILDVKINDTFIVRPGETIPVDGIITKGNTSVDESMLTGEFVPIDKNEGLNIYQGTINKLGTIEAKAIKVGEDTSLSQIIKLVDEASSSRANISKLADRVSKVFVPVVLIISLITFITWFILGLNNIIYYSINETNLSYSLNKAISVLVISCPCALGLATPVAVMVGSGKGAKNGILFKNAISLEETGKTNFVILDKTGTITEGKPEISNIIPFNISKEELLKYAYSIEIKSSHPLAKAITDIKINDSYEVNNFNTLLGFGVSGEINNKEILGVNLDFAINNNYINDEQIKICNDLSNKGETPLLFIYDNKLIGLISVKDKIKEDSKLAIKKLKSLGIALIMVTGDNELVAKEISKEVGIDYYVSNVKPSGKQEIIKKLKEYGKVMMVGDGINDAIALKEANIGVAIGNGTDVAIDSADIILMKSSLLDSYKAIRLSQKTLLNIKENLFWAFIYNIIMIPIAAGLFIKLGISLKPWYGAASMSLSSVTVVLNALRLNIVSIEKNRFRRNKFKNLDINKIINIENGGKNMEQKFNVEGMMCAHCAKHVEEACKKVNNVLDAKVSLDDKNVTVSYEGKLDIDSLRNNIKEAGYDPKF